MYLDALIRKNTLLSEFIATERLIWIELMSMVSELLLLFFFETQNLSEIIATR